MTHTVMNAGRGVRMIRVKRASYLCCSHRVIGDSRRSSAVFDNRMKPSAGVTVSATTMEASTASAYESASGLKNEPERPSMRKTGNRVTASISVA